MIPEHKIWSKQIQSTRKPTGSVVHQGPCSISLTWKLVRNAKSQSPGQTHWVRIWFNMIPQWLLCPLKSRSTSQRHRGGREFFQLRATKKGFLKEASFEEERERRITFVECLLWVRNCTRGLHFCYLLESSASLHGAEINIPLWQLRK